MSTLYRKYRPQTFKEVVGQNHIKITLEHEIATGKIAHAYLFCGPRAVGKTTMARVFAKAVNCTKRKEGENEPCNKCEICEDITRGSNLDIIEIDAASQTGVDNVRENIIANSRVAPVRSKFKVFIIDEVHMLSIQAFNALLKIIEEPPKYIIFILCTTETHKVPATIISRCQRFDFKRIGVNDIAKKMQYIAGQEGIKIDKKILESIARQSEGHMRDAESLLGQVVAIGGKEITPEEADLVIPRSDLIDALKLIDSLAKKDAAAAIGLVNNLVDEGINLKVFLSDTIELLRKILLSKISPVLAGKLSLEFGEDIEKQINNLSSNLVVSQIISYIEKFQTARNELKGSFIAQLPIEIAIAELCITKPVSNFSASVSPNQNTGNFQTPQNTRPFTSTEKQRTNASPAKDNKTVNAVLSKENIISKWNEVLARVKKYNHSLSFILRVCQPVSIAGNQLCLAFKYKFHKERMGDSNIRSLVEKVLYEVYGQNLAVEAIIDENLVEYRESNVSTSSNAGNVQNLEEGTEKKESKNEDKGAGDNMIENLLKTFGGKVIS